MRFFDGPDTVRRARGAFHAAGYTLDAVTERLGPHVFAHLSAGELAPLMRATRVGDRLDVLARLFLVGEPVINRDACEAALAPVPVQQWAAGGLVAVEGEEAEGFVAIRPLGDPEDRLVAHDRPDPSGAVSVRLTAFELADFLRAHDDAALLDAVLRVAPDVVLDERAQPTPDGWVVATRQLRQTAGLGHHGDVDPGVAAIVGGCDGRRPLVAVLETAAGDAGVELGALTAAALPLVRRLIERAFLLPVAPE